MNFPPGYPFAVGCYVMLQPRDRPGDFPHLGRIGPIFHVTKDNLVVKFFQDDLIGVNLLCAIPLPYWTPIPAFLVERYEVRTLKHGWRLTQNAPHLLDVLGWPHTAASLGVAVNDPGVPR